MKQSYFSKEAATRAIRFIEALKHTKGRWANVKFKLEPWQRDGIIAPLFGTLEPDGNRAYRTAYISVPRKNGKSTLCAAIALYLLFADGEQGAEIYGAACDRDQASLVFDIAAQMVRRNPGLAKRAKIIDSTKRILYPATGSFYRAIAADAPGSWGSNPHAVIADELHAWPRRDLWDALTTGSGTRAQPLTIAITTAGWDQTSVWFEVYDYARQVLNGTIKDDTYFSYIREPKEGDDWKDRKVWKACNPGLGTFRSLAEMKALAQRAERSPSLQNTFRRLYENDAHTTQADRAIDMGLWDENAGIVREDELANRPCFGGLDLGETNDMTSWALLFPRDDGYLDILIRYWVPEARLEDSENRYRTQYQGWVQQGWLKTTPGATIRSPFITAQILEDAKRFKLVDLNLDPWHAKDIALELEDKGLKVAQLGQGFAGMSGPTAEFQRRLLERTLRHGGNPILRWNVDNLAFRQDPAGNQKPDKAASTGKIDGIPALLNALDRVMRHEDDTSVYEGRGLRHMG
jgi:phage terminase large subunit-like protein